MGHHRSAIHVFAPIIPSWLKAEDACHSLASLEGVAVSLVRGKGDVRLQAAYCFY